MVEKADLEYLTGLAMQEQGRAQMRPVIQKELLHYDILYSLDAESLLDQLTFQGGTSLRLCYGSNRFSEDLDFVGGRTFTREKLRPIKQCIEHYIGRRYGLEVSVKEPAETRKEREKAGLNVDKWQVSVITAPEHKDVPWQRIKIEVVNIDACSREPRPLRVNYPFLPDGYGDTLVLTETLDEVMADKLVSLVNTQGYVRNRDIWDLRWLKQQGAQVQSKWVEQKIQDYRVEDYLTKIGGMRQNLPAIVRGDVFRREMTRFLPQDVTARTLDRPKFYDVLAADVAALFDQLERALRGLEPTTEFEM